MHLNLWCILLKCRQRTGELTACCLPTYRLTYIGNIGSWFKQSWFHCNELYFRKINSCIYEILHESLSNPQITIPPPQTIFSFSILQNILSQCCNILNILIHGAAAGPSLMLIRAEARLSAIYDETWCKMSVGKYADIHG